ncbi:NAD(P)-dependent oxidoreductase [Mycetocola spongiae]|uniref:NAD(P)-dependent oxidoreductase n=1 Tax=Mycetocola spongiae TaxID=2859226 RepID=UPI0021F4F861|nr:NAD(P)-dependent oxidoreductase [Mycetocola spongiae]
MGAPMTLNLLAHRPEGVPVTVHARSPERLAPLVTAGARAAGSLRELASASEAIILMLPDLPQITEVLAGPEGLLAGIERPTVLVVSSSVSPDGVRALAERLDADTAGLLRVVDAPVSGGTEGAEAGTLSIMVGGDAPTVARVTPVLATMGTPVHLGPLGSGQVAKACNQMIVAATMTAISEAAVIAERSGIDLAVLLPLLQAGYAGSRVLETKQDRLIRRDYTPTGVAAFMVKDLTAAAAEAARTATRTPQLDTVRTVFDDLVAAGLGPEDLAVVHRFVREH